jgi:FtsH-binding integral membrane protein
MTYVQWLKQNPPLPQIIGAIMLLWALVSANPYGYYVLMRIVLCAIFVFLAVKAHELNRVGWVWVLAITAALYNPIIRVHLNREIWSAVNVATIVLLTVTVVVLRKKNESS